jgi:hypothetical protein
VRGENEQLSHLVFLCWDAPSQTSEVNLCLTTCFNSLLSNEETSHISAHIELFTDSGSKFKHTGTKVN